MFSELGDEEYTIFRLRDDTPSAEYPPPNKQFVIVFRNVIDW